MPRHASVLLAAVLVLCGCGGAGSAGDGERPDLVVAAASSLKAPFTAYGSSFEPADARFSFAGSDELAAQIRQGVEPDVLAAADLEVPAALHADRLVEEPVVFASGRLVLAVPADSDVRALEDLVAPGIAVVIGSDSVPVGVYARRALARAPGGLGARILARVRSHEPDVSGIVGKLTHGAADAGFVYATDVRATHGALRAIDLPAELQPRVAYAAAVVRGAAHPEEARAFRAGLLRGPGRAALQAAGFDPPPSR